MKYIFVIILIFNSFFGVSQTWEDVGGGNSNSTHGLLTWNGLLVNLGSFNNTPCDRVATWDGTSWSCLGGGVGIVARAGVVWDGKLVVVGDFWNNFQPCVGCNGVAVWDGVSWSPLGNGVNNDVLTCTVWNNELVIGGDMTEADGVPIARIAKWNGATWESIGPIGSFDNDIRCMTEFEGELWVGGDFNNVGGQGPLDGLVKYDEVSANWVGGNSGVDLVGGVNESVRVLYVNPNDGNLYLGGEFPELIDGDVGIQDFNMSGIAMYDGSNWTPLGTGLNEYCRAIHEYNGNIVAGGYFTSAGGVAANKIAKWDGSIWSPMGQGFDAVGVDEYVKASTVWNGIFFAGGAYTQAEGNPMNYIAQWYEAATAPPVAWMTTSTTQLCGAGCVEFLDNSTNAPTSWNWSFPGADIQTSTAQDPGQICYSMPGTYTATLEVCNGFGCTTQDIDIEVTAGASVSVNDVSDCSGGPVTLTAVPSVLGGTFFWQTTGETTASITVNPATTTNYQVTYSYLGCTSNAISTVTVGVAPTITLAGDNLICEGDLATLTATPSVTGGTYSWLPGGETTSSISVSPSTTTTYSVVYTINGCSSASTNETVTVNETPTLTMTDDVICSGETGTVSALPSASGGTYLWSPGGETTSSVSDNLLASASYTVVYTLNGCSSISEIATVTVNEIPNVSVSDGVICSGESITITASPSTIGGNYIWSPNGETTSSISVSPSTTSTYSVTYTLNGCSSVPEMANVTVNEPPVITVNDASICEGQTAVLSVTSSSIGGTYLWSPGNETTSFITVSPSVNTIYSVIYTVDGCSSLAASGTVTVQMYPDVIVSEMNNTLTAQETNGVFQWLDCVNGNSEINGENGQSYAPITNGSYSVEIDLNGCVDTSACMQVISISIMEESMFEEYILYPNPAKTDLNIVGVNDLFSVPYQVLDLNGKIVLKGVFGSEHKIKVDELSKGVYLLSISNLSPVPLLFVKQ